MHARRVRADEMERGIAGPWAVFNAAGDALADGIASPQAAEEFVGYFAAEVLRADVEAPLARRCRERATIEGLRVLVELVEVEPEIRDEARRQLEALGGR